VESFSDLSRVMRERNLNTNNMNTIERDDLMNFVESNTNLSLCAASAGGTDWEFLTFESDLDDDDLFNSIDIWNYIEEDGIYHATFEINKTNEDECDSDSNYEVWDAQYENLEDLLEDIKNFN
jgi:hypothetical protein